MGRVRAPTRGLKSARAPALAAALATVAALAACAGGGPPGDLEPPDLFEWAHERFDLGEYEDAAEGFLAFMLRDPLSPLVDSAQFLAAEGRLRGGRELDAIEEFRRMATNRPNSPLAPAAQLGLCRSYLAASPRVTLSQEFTRRAIEECQRLLQFFPTSPHIDDAETLIADARVKLAEKNYEIGKFYEDNRRLPESAIVYYELALTEAAGGAFLPDLLWRLYRSYRRVGFDTEAAALRGRLLEEFPESEGAEAIRAEDGPAQHAGAERR